MLAIFIGRFQPFHKGHLAAIKWILKREKKIFIVIGSTQESNTKQNPLLFSERKEIIRKTLLTEKIKNFKIYGLRDSPNDVFWAQKILRLTKAKPENIIVFTQNPWTKRCFRKIKVKAKPHPLFFNKLSATKIRNKIVQGKKWTNLVPKSTLKTLKKINIKKRIQSISV